MAAAHTNLCDLTGFNTELQHYRESKALTPTAYLYLKIKRKNTSSWILRSENAVYQAPVCHTYLLLLGPLMSHILVKNKRASSRNPVRGRKEGRRRKELQEWAFASVFYTLE